MEIQKYHEDRLVLNFGLLSKPPNLEGAKIREWKGRGGNILRSLPSNFSNHARGGAHFPSPSLPFPQTKQALRVCLVRGEGRENGRRENFCEGL